MTDAFDEEVAEILARPILKLVSDRFARLKVGIIGRESPGKKDHEKRGVARQVEKGVIYARRNGGEVTKIYREPGTSAYKARRQVLPDGEVVYRVPRPRLDEAIKDLKAGVIDVLIVERLDRIDRKSVV